MSGPSRPTITSVSPVEDAPGVGHVTISWASQGSGIAYHVFKSQYQGMTSGCQSQHIYLGSTSSTSFVDPSVPSGVAAFYVVRATNASSGSDVSLEWQTAVPHVLSVEPRQGTANSLRVLGENPTHRLIQCEISTNKGGVIAVALYDIAGRAVMKRALTVPNSGVYRIDLDTLAGRVGAGMYFARAVLDGGVVGSRRIVLIR